MIRDEDWRPDRAADDAADALSKVPRVTFAFWAVKILATTLGETGGDALSMTLKLGYAESTLIFLVVIAAAMVVLIALTSLRKRASTSALRIRAW